MNDWTKIINSVYSGDDAFFDSFFANDKKSQPYYLSGNIVLVDNEDIELANLILYSCNLDAAILNKNHEKSSIREICQFKIAFNLNHA